MRSPVERRIGLLGGADRTWSCLQPTDANDPNPDIGAKDRWTSISYAIAITIKCIRVMSRRPGWEWRFTEGFLRVLRSMGSSVALPRGEMFQR
jgi:hypothetical protein